MTTLTIKINERSNYGKVVINLLRTSAGESKAVQLVETEESPYNPAFVKKVLDAANSKKRYRIDPKNIWESIL